VRRAKAISFDYGHVLGGLDLGELARRIDRARAPLDAALPEAYDAHDRAIAEGRGHEAGWRALMRTLLEAAKADDLEASIDRLWRAQPTRNLWRHVPAEARAMLRQLSERGVPMTVTSNSEGRVRELLEEVGIAHHFVAILDSGLLGFAKPDPRIFSLAAETLGVPVEDVVHVGDSEAADVVGAKNAGALAVRFDAFLPRAGGRPTVADARAGTFEELIVILLRMLDRSG
jgi:HAD superfamily hydrolase (TIGR01549 family)